MYVMHNYIPISTVAAYTMYADTVYVNVYIHINECYQCVPNVYMLHKENSKTLIASCDLHAYIHVLHVYMRMSIRVYTNIAYIDVISVYVVMIYGHMCISAYTYV